MASNGHRIHRAILVAACLSIPALGEVTAQEEAALPGGASSLQEAYQDWLVSCVQENGKRCALSQRRTQQNGPQILAIELVPAGDDGTATGTLVLPFELDLDAGVTLQVDDSPPSAPLRFSTCVAGGCLVPLSLDAALLDRLRAGEALKVRSKAADSDRAVPLSISLKGFGAAVDRWARWRSEQTWCDRRFIRGEASREVHPPGPHRSGAGPTCVLSFPDQDRLSHCHLATGAE